MNQKKLPLVSIVIPVYNGANYLAEAIESALNQTYENIEIIVVNDGSTDNGETEEVVLRYRDKVRYYKKENGGSSSALNCGIRNMQGEWFSWLSHDDLYYPQKIEKQVELMQGLGLKGEELYKHIFFCGFDLIDGVGKLIRKAKEQEMKDIATVVNGLNGNEKLIAEPARYTFHGCGCLVHKETFEKVGLFDESLRLLNDVDMWYRIYVAGTKVHYLPEALVKGRVHANQVSRSIGFSYHNSEQDMFWNRSFRWLMENHPDNAELFWLYGRNAYLKTRTDDGDQAFAIVAGLKPTTKLTLLLQKTRYRLCATARTFAKQVYLKLSA